MCSTNTTQILKYSYLQKELFVQSFSLVVVQEESSGVSKMKSFHPLVSNGITPLDFDRGA